MDFGVGSSNISKNAAAGSSNGSGTAAVDAGMQFSALVVDDASINRIMHERLLKKLGVITRSVGDGKQAVELFNSGDTFHLVIMDMHMPVMDGPEATKALRAMGVDSLIVGVTAADEADRNKFMEAGLDFIYPKPLTGEMAKTLFDELVKRNY